MAKILVTGAARGLGRLIAHQLREDGHTVTDFDAHWGDDVRLPLGSPSFKRLTSLDVLINCAGVNLIDWLDRIDEWQWDEVMDVNAKGIFKMTQACLPMLINSKGTVLNIVSNASHMPMTCSLAYNASKGAAHIMTLQLARELTRRYGITVFGISPNKLAGTDMSQSIEEQVITTRGWTREQAHNYQLASLLAGEETDPEELARFIAYLLQNKNQHKFLTGCVLPYGA